MSTGLSSSVVRVAHTMPKLASAAMHLSARVIAPHRPPWILCRVAADLNDRILVDTRLGNGMPIRVVWTDVIGYSICVDGYYDTSTIRVLENLLKPGMTFVDVGAHVGQYTLVASEIVGREGSVHSFEPEPETRKLLQHNISHNSLVNVRVNDCALGATGGEVRLYVARPDNLGQTSLRPPDNFSGVTVSVPRRTLDDYARETNLKRIDVIKIDVEGAELSVLQGADEILGGPSKPALIIEFWENFQRQYGSSCVWMTKFLEAKGYRLFWIGEGGLKPYTPQEPVGKHGSEPFNVLATAE